MRSSSGCQSLCGEPVKAMWTAWKTNFCCMPWTAKTPLVRKRSLPFSFKIYPSHSFSFCWLISPLTWKPQEVTRSSCWWSCSSARKPSSISKILSKSKAWMPRFAKHSKTVEQCHLNFWLLMPPKNLSNWGSSSTETKPYIIYIYIYYILYIYSYYYACSRSRHYEQVNPPTHHWCLVGQWVFHWSVFSLLESIRSCSESWKIKGLEILYDLIILYHPVSSGRQSCSKKITKNAQVPMMKSMSTLDLVVRLIFTASLIMRILLSTSSRWGSSTRSHLLRMMRSAKATFFGLKTNSQIWFLVLIWFLFKI